MKPNFDAYNLNKEIQRTLSDLGYEEPTIVQSKVIPLVLEQKDLVVTSQTGSGKTAAYAIPICQLVDWLENKPQALILTPTRELAVQVKEDFINIGRFKRIKATAVYGRQPFSRQKIELKQKTHIVVGTPGRVQDHLERGTLVLEKVRYLVIDEADEMLKMGFIDQVEKIIRQLPRQRVTLLFSATLPEAIKNLSFKYMKDPMDIKMETENLTVDKIEHGIYKVEEMKKFSLLLDVTIIENPDSSIIFCRTKDQVDQVCDRLKDLGYQSDKIHGGMEQDDRLEAMNQFKMGKFRYLVATDVAARGIDVENVNLVVNYDIPLEKESYVHRTGRTGRAGKSGKAITFVTSAEKRYLSNIEEYIGFEIPTLLHPSKSEVTAQKVEFEEKRKGALDIKETKSQKINEKIVKLYFNGGKNKKLRAVDFVGTISKIDGVCTEDIGIITILDTISYVEILNGKGVLVLNAMKNITIKGKKLKVAEANRKNSK